jgi:hypothetical protein
VNAQIFVFIDRLKQEQVEELDGVLGIFLIKWCKIYNKEAIKMLFINLRIVI